MKFEEIKNNPEILVNLRWDLTPQTAGIPNGYTITCQADFDNLNAILQERAGYYFYVDVWDCQAALALMHNKADGNGVAERITDFDSPYLEKAVYKAGGSITRSGWYPITPQLQTLIKRKLGLT